MNKRIWTYVFARTGASEGAMDGQTEAEGLPEGLPDPEVAGIEDGNSEEVVCRVGIDDGSSEEFS